ncbi:hypothetical protein SRABI118_04258 [Massilia sp. Bi118]|uniref:cytochrome b/b6 domain-containing protein n=1 Tax=Massilia sp. Bi118 TaxID=2822346 RepID=UPI001D3E4866|nr:cytochrome b/b6 domain-containing protein [Massilia sp. Bi118]CAH0296916.1 hypothetical protein SRABI118_04258 [Massilia sp. Bi118]
MQPSRVRPSFYRHRLPVRLMHWINVISFFLMLMSGLGIFNAHPHLYWGRASNFEAPLLSITARPGPDGQPQGYMQVDLMRILVVARPGHIRGGAGGYWEDQGYEWYAGI